MGQHYISKSREAAIEASGKTLAELIDLGCEAAAYEQTARDDPERAGSRAVRDRRRPTQDDCKHPLPRRSKGGLCMACGRNVG